MLTKKVRMQMKQDKKMKKTEGDCRIRCSVFVFGSYRFLQSDYTESP